MLRLTGRASNICSLGRDHPCCLGAAWVLKCVPEVPQLAQVCRMRVLRGKLAWYLPRQSSVVGPLLSLTPSHS